MGEVGFAGSASFALPMPMEVSFAASRPDAFARYSRTACARRFDRRRFPAPVPVVSVCPSTL